MPIITRGPGRRGRARLLSAAGTAGLVPLLAGCAFLPSFPSLQGPTPTPTETAVSSVGEVKGATMSIIAQGTFLQLGDLTPYEGRWGGSGWFISPDGHAVTNNHVVTGAGTLRVAIGGDGQSYAANLIAASECYDLAVIKVDLPAAVPFLSWHSGDIREGDEVYSAGYPAALGYKYTLTKGIVSQADTKTATPWADVEHAIQHDARIRGGNSGGPLVDSSGTVFGVNYAGENLNDTNIAVGRGSAQDTIQKLRNSENVLSLGLNIEAIPPDEYGFHGIWVSSVKPGSAADKAGLKPGDVIEKLNGVTMGLGGTVAGYCDVLRTHGTEATLSVQAWRPATDQILEGQINGSALKVTGGASAGAGGAGGGGGGGTSPTSYVDLTSDDGHFSVTVPSHWKDAFSQADPATGVHVFVASSNVKAFDNGQASGVAMAGRAGAVSEEAVRAGLESASGTMGGSCTPATTAESYADGYFTGLYSTWTRCNGQEAEALVMSLNKDDGSAQLLMTLILVGTDIDDTTINKVLTSFDVSF